MMQISTCRACEEPTPLEELASEEMCTACCHKAFGLTGLDADWDAEAERLFARLNFGDADGGGGGKHNNLDAIWRDAGSGARVFVGNRRAAMSKRILEPHGIVSIVNCQDATTVNAFEGKGIGYFRLDVQHWPDALGEDKGALTSDALLAYFERCFAWIRASLARGESVLVHCYAGAHRAGTVGVAFLMATARLRLAEALRLTQRCRPIVNPFARLLKLLHLYESALDEAGYYGSGGGAAAARAEVLREPSCATSAASCGGKAATVSEDGR